MKRLETGVFLPNARNGFVFSGAATPYKPSYEENLQITLDAERLGFDYVFAMAKWRGFGGVTGFWDASMESLSLITGLAAATSRIKLIATMTPLLFNPALVAKMAVTVDDISTGRLGINIVTGAFLAEYAQMGVLPAGYDQKRYVYAAEWIELVKRLWTEPTVSHHGEFFHLDECVSEPKPAPGQRPFLVCAAASDEGLAFTARHADRSFVSEESIEATKRKALRAKQIAAEHGSSLKTDVLVMLVLGDDKADAEAYWQRLVDAADVDALRNAGKSLVAESRESARGRGALKLSNESQVALGLPIIGGPAEVAEELAGLAIDGDVDGVLFCFPDYAEGLERFSSGVVPLLQQHVHVGSHDA